MAFLNPTYLWALLGLLVPIAIHLWSKKEGKTIKVGSIELLRESESKQTSSIRPNELWLLLLRMFIIALVAVILVEPQLKLHTENTSITYLIEPSLLTNEKSADILNTIDEDSDIRLLASGFPELEDVDIENITTETPNYWQLAKDMQTLASDSIVVYTKALVSGLKGMRPTVNKSIEWLIISSDDALQKTPISARKIDNNIELLSMESRDAYTAFEKTSMKETDVNQTDLEITTENPVNILLHHNDAFSEDSKYLEASLSAVSKHINRPFDIAISDTPTTPDKTYDLVIWLDPNNPAPKTDNKLLVYKADALSNSLIEESTTKTRFYLTAHLNTKNSLENHLPEQLLNILNLNAGLKNIIQKNDKRTVSKAELLPTVAATKVKNKNTNYASMATWLWLMLGITLLTERLMASYRKQ